MNQLEELKIHASALSTAVEQDSKFFASIRHYVHQLVRLAGSPREEASQDELLLVVNAIEKFFAKWRPSPGVLYIEPRQTSDCQDTVKRLKILADELSSLDKTEFSALFHSAYPSSRVSNVSQETNRLPPCVFIGHGRSKLWARVKIFIEDELGLATVFYEQESRVGEGIVPVLEQMLEKATFAVLVLTAEDEISKGQYRARQNVIHESGLFQGRLGFKRAVLLVQEGIENLSNVDGLQYIPFSEDKIDQTFYELQRVLKREGMITNTIET